MAGNSSVFRPIVRPIAGDRHQGGSFCSTKAWGDPTKPDTV